MNPNPVTQTIRIILATLFLIWLLVFSREGHSEEFAVPNHGSPYLDLGSLDVGQILHLPTGMVVSLKQMMDSISASRVIYIGETHDNIEAHKVQLQIIQLLSEKYQVAIGLEMFRRSAQEKLYLWNRGQLSLREFKNLFHSNWGEGFGLYQHIFEFAQSKNLPLIGLKSTHEVENHFRAGDPAPGDTLYPEIDDTDPYHRAFTLSAFGGHRGTAAMRIEGRPYTTIERSLVERMVHVMLSDLSAAFEPLSPVTFRFDRLETNPRFATISRPSNAAIVTRLRIDMEDRGGRLELLLPYATLEPVRELLLQSFMGEKFGRDSIWETHLAEELWLTEVDLEAVVDQQIMRLSDVFDLKIGSRIMFSATPDSLVSLQCGNIPMYSGVMGRKGNKIAIRIEDRIEKKPR